MAWRLASKSVSRPTSEKLAWRPGHTVSFSLDVLLLWGCGVPQDLVPVMVWVYYVIIGFWTLWVSSSPNLETPPYLAICCRLIAIRHLQWSGFDPWKILCSGRIFTWCVSRCLLRQSLVKFRLVWPTALPTLRSLACEFRFPLVSVRDLYLYLHGQTALKIERNRTSLISFPWFPPSQPLHRIVKFSMCSAIGQSFIFYTISVFDPLVCSTVTTTRKIFSVLLSIFTKGHNLSTSGWAGISLAISGIISEMQAKYSASRARHYKSKVSMWK